MPDDTIAADEVEAELPDGWWAENDGDQRVYAYSGRGEPGDVSASAEIEHTSGDLFLVWWNEPGEQRGGLHEPTEATEATKERAINWLAEKAEP